MSMDILVVDDESDIRELISEILKDEGYNPRTARSSDEALKSLAERVPGMVILDIWLQGSELDGLGVLEIAQAKYPNLPIVMISGHGNIETAVSAIRMGAFDFIEKPFTAEKLLYVIQRTLDMSRLKSEHSELKMRHASTEASLIGNSAAITAVRQVIEKVAPTNSRVMITGEEGTGKEVVARMIHEKSGRNKGNFVVLNAASISQSQMDIELFGTEDSNPGGGAERLGVFERAHGGTLFIDEIADMHWDTQGRILRAMQEQAFERVRGSHRVKVDVRVIAASNRDLKAEIAAGNFREDLYYRLNIVPIHMPSLSDRREDIPELARCFLKQASDAANIPLRKMSDDALAVLQAYSWPGNVRHLRNIMEWIVIMSQGDTARAIEPDDMPPELSDGNVSTFSRSDDNNAIMTMPLREAREIFERQYLSAQIARFGGNISKTSAFIGMERSALHRKLKMLGIHSDEKMMA